MSKDKHCTAVGIRHAVRIKTSGSYICQEESAARTQCPDANRGKNRELAGSWPHRHDLHAAEATSMKLNWSRTSVSITDGGSTDEVVIAPLQKQSPQGHWSEGLGAEGSESSRGPSRSDPSNSSGLPQLQVSTDAREQQRSPTQHWNGHWTTRKASTYWTRRCFDITTRLWIAGNLTAILGHGKPMVNLETPSIQVTSLESWVKQRLLGIIAISG